VDQERIQVITTHIRDVICSGDAELYAYILKYMKLVLDGQKTGVAVCFYGEQGVGKSAFAEYFGRQLVGDEYYAYAEGLNKLLSKFSSHRCYKCWVVCDEPERTPSHAEAQRLKSMVTQDRTTHEAKGARTQ
jgi:phage/plasmid-associated DNA primase